VRRSSTKRPASSPWCEAFQPEFAQHGPAGADELWNNLGSLPAAAGPAQRCRQPSKPLRAWIAAKARSIPPIDATTF